MIKTIACNQPYAFPYLGWFRLLSDSDLFVVLDCVQFPRRGWCHRNKLLNRNGVLEWLTLPLEYATQDAPIETIIFAYNGVERMAEQMRRFPAFDRLPEAIVNEVRDARGALVTYNMRVLEACCWELGIKFNVAHSSGLNLPDELKGQARILEICRRLGATRYLNATGGIDLYDPVAFARAGVELAFLPPWEGSYASVLQVLADRERVAA